MGDNVFVGGGVCKFDLSFYVKICWGDGLFIWNINDKSILVIELNCWIWVLVECFFLVKSYIFIVEI